MKDFFEKGHTFAYLKILRNLGLKKACMKGEK